MSMTGRGTCGTCGNVGHCRTLDPVYTSGKECQDSFKGGYGKGVPQEVKKYKRLGLWLASGRRGDFMSPIARSHFDGVSGTRPNLRYWFGGWLPDSSYLFGIHCTVGAAEMMPSVALRLSPSLLLKGVGYPGTLHDPSTRTPMQTEAPKFL